MARADGLTFTEGLRREPNLTPAYLKRMALLHLRIHNCEATHFAEQEDIHLRMVSTAKDNALIRA